MKSKVGWTCNVIISINSCSKNNRFAYYFFPFINIFHDYNHKELLRFVNVSFTYQSPYYIKNQSAGKLNTSDKKILNDFNAVIEKNSLVLLQGKNGSGKTTFLKILLNHENIQFAGTICKNYHNRDLEYMPQHLHQTWRLPLTVLELLLISKPTLKNNNPILKFYLEFLDLSSKKKPKHHELSGGQRQKLYLLRTLLAEQKIILMDEPLSYLDKESEKKVAQIIGELLLQQKTVIIATHSNYFLKHLPLKIKKKYQIKIISLDQKQNSIT